MPTQSGIHQFRGKYGTTCYYFTKGKQNGLQRGINQQMSERVKRDPEFANTRLYAREFGYCGRLAALSFVPTEFGLTINLRNNSQGRLTKIYRNLLNEYGNGEFGHRSFNGLEWQPQFVAQINAMCRVETDLLYPITHTITLDPTTVANRYNVIWKIEWNNTLVDRMKEMGLNSLWLRLRHFTLNSGHYNADAGAYVDIAREVGGYSADYQLPLSYAQTHTEYTVTIHNARIVYPMDSSNTAIGGNSLLSRPMVAVEGYRRVGNVDFKQQGLCGFKVLDNATITNYNPEYISYNGVLYRSGDPAPTSVSGASGSFSVYCPAFDNYADMKQGSAKVSGLAANITLQLPGAIVVSYYQLPLDARITSVEIEYPDGHRGAIYFT